MLNIQLEQVLPSEIERRSFELIDQELKSMGVRLKPEQEPVIKRARVRHNRAIRCFFTGFSSL